MAERLIDRGVQGSRVQKFNQIPFDAIGYTFLRPIIVSLASLNRKKVRCAFFAVGLSFFSFAGASPLLAASVSGWEAEWARTVELAKKEGKVSVFLYQRENIEAAVKIFEIKYPEIQVITASTPAAETGPRLMRP